MTTLHRIFSLRFLVVLICSIGLPFGIHAQQTKHPMPIDTACNCGGPAITNTPTNAGTDFLLCFEENIDRYFDSMYSSGSYLDIYIASLGDTATITITSREYPAMNKVFFLNAGSSMTYRVTDDTIKIGNIVENLHDLWVVSDEVPDNAVVEVQSSSPIVCYGMDFKDASADAFCALAKESAGTDYEVICYPNSQSASPYTASQFVAAAFEDDDTVTITPSVVTLGDHAAGVPFQVILQQGQCVQVETYDSIPNLDLTGSRISSNHPITVYSGHQRTEAPEFYSDSTNGISRDMLLEVMPPTSTWGNAFVFNAIDLELGTAGPQGDVMRVLALDSNTIVTINGIPWDTLGSKQHPSLFSDTMVAVPSLVTSSGPLLVGEIEHSDYYIGGGGDPSLSIVPPVDQTFNNFTFFSSSDIGNFGYNGLIVAADNRSVASITLDGTLLPNFFFTPVPGSVGGRSFSIYEAQLQTTGAHTISSTMPADQGFTILAYGLGNVISYGYTAGSLLVPKRAIRIDYPPETMGPIHPNVLNFRNTAYQPAYLDSALFVPDNFKDGAFGIHSQEDVGSDIGRLDIGEGAQIHLVPTIPLTWPISGTVKIYAHTPSYWSLDPGEMHFTLYPSSAADVSQSNGTAIPLTATPNPFSTYTTINFSVPEAGDITMTLYDELGRAVQHIASSEFSAGPYSVRVDRRGLPNGVYVCEITSEKLNIHQRIPIVASE